MKLKYFCDMIGFSSLVIIIPLIVHGQDTYTSQEEKAILQFRNLIGKSLTKPYMYENKYLIRWLRSSGLNVQESEKKIRKSLEWRKEHNIDNILNEDWSSYEKQYPFDFRLKDYKGRPALSSRIGSINVRRLILQGQREKIRRYLLYGFERAIDNIHKVSNETGKEFIGTHLLFNMAGYDIRTHSCIECISGWVTLVNNYENNYPHLAETMSVVNTPRIFEVLYSIIKPLTSARTQKVLHLYGVNKDEWKTAILHIYPENQLTPEFGGTYKS